MPVGSNNGALTTTDAATSRTNLGITNVATQTLTQHSVLVGGATNAITSLSVAATGTVLAGSTGADPAFTATPSVTSITLGGGSALGTYINSTFTPVVQFGGGSTGITYTTQSGKYVQIGQIVHFEILIVLSSKGSSSGSMTITGMPVASAGPPTFPAYIAVGVTAPASTTYSIAQISTTTLSILGINGATNGAAAYTDTNVGNNTQFFINGTYFV